MQVINQNIARMPILNVGELNIENAARTCYKSEDRIGCQRKSDEPCSDFNENVRCRNSTCEDNSAYKLVDLLIRKGHTPMLEFMPLCVAVPPDFAEKLNVMVGTGLFPGARVEITPNHGFISGNLLGIIRIAERLGRMGEKTLLNACFDVAPTVMALQGYTEKDLGFLQYFLVDTQTPPPGSRQPEQHMYAMCRIITNRGVTHELVRHRPPSFAQESTRYCDYGEIKYIKPVFASDAVLGEWAYGPNGDLNFDGRNVSDLREITWLKSCAAGELDYKRLRELDWPPQYARDVLNNALKTEIVVLANIAEWRHIFYRRCDPAAHPQIKELADIFQNMLFDSNNMFCPI